MAAAVCLSRMQFRIGTPLGDPTSVQVAVMACRVEDGSSVRTVDVLDFDFFDDESIVVVLKAADGERRGA